MIFKIRIKKWNKLLIVLFAIVVSGLAQTMDPIELVLEINREVLAADKAYQAAKEKIKVSGVLPDPMIESSFSINSIETRNGPIENQIMVGQKFPLWGKLRRERNIEKIRADISRLNLDNTKVRISFLLRKRLAEYFKLSESLEILEQYKVELESFENLIGKKAKVSTIKTEKIVPPNVPFNLTNLQTEAYRSEEHTSELQSHSFISYAVFCLKKKKLK